MSDTTAINFVDLKYLDKLFSLSSSIIKHTQNNVLIGVFFSYKIYYFQSAIIVPYNVFKQLSLTRNFTNVSEGIIFLGISAFANLYPSPLHQEHQPPKLQPFKKHCFPHYSRFVTCWHSWQNSSPNAISAGIPEPSRYSLLFIILTYFQFKLFIF